VTDQPRTAQEQMRRTPRLVAHLISQSGGYFTPTSAALALSSHRAGLPFSCEMYTTYAGDSSGPSYDTDRLLAVNADEILAAFKNRRHHHGYMRQPIHGTTAGIVQASIDSDGQNEPVFASWF